MGNYGFRISKSGQDVKTCSDVNTILSSKYPLLKGAISGTITMSPGWSGTLYAYITHSFGYIPFAYLVFEPDYYPSPGPGDHPEWAISPVSITVSSGGKGYDMNAWFHSLTNTIEVLVWISTTDWWHNPLTINVKYFIFKDKGKL